MRHVADDLTAYLDGALAPGPRAQVESHLVSCAACSARRDRIAAALRALAALPPPPEPSAGFARRFQARLEAEPARGGLLRALAAARWRWLAPAAGAAAAAGVALYAGARHRAAERDMAAWLDLLQNYELVASVGAVESAEDVEVVAHLDEIERARP